MFPLQHSNNSRDVLFSRDQGRTRVTNQKKHLRWVSCDANRDIRHQEERHKWGCFRSCGTWRPLSIGLSYRKPHSLQLRKLKLWPALQSCLNQEKTRTFPFLYIKRSHYRTREIEITDSAASDSLFKILIYWNSYLEME